MEGKIDMAARRQVTNKLRRGYARASKVDKGWLLTEVMGTTGMGRSTARRTLTGPDLRVLSRNSAEELDAAYGEAVGVLPGVVSKTGGPLAFVDDEDHPGASPGPGTLHFAFDTDEGGTVTRLRSGFWPWVGYTDYCSPAADHPERTGWPLVGK